ncbi:MAG: hydantoinase/oxoprolinase family protein [Solirubrobacteraceae bacterium]|nr:hydantoinase/oxoprolinase family protein [Solirubrobacteraceae bacterium]
MPETRDLRIGIDVGGTNTDAVVMDESDRIVARTKQATTEDVTGGMQAALTAVLEQIGDDAARIGRVMLGTTHATNAILERRALGRVGVVRLGAPATMSLSPMESWPAELREVVSAGWTILRGGHYIDGRRISALDEEGIAAFARSLAGRADAIAITAVFSPASGKDELRAAEIVRGVLGDDFPVSLSHEISSLGIVERESATILNAALFGVAGHVVRALDDVLLGGDLDVETYFAQNDGTLMAVEFAEQFPILTIGSGPANSLRGAAYLSGESDAIVVDVGGTSSDLGVLIGGFPRESAAAVEIGGVRTNFRMPDILAIALGGGTIVSGTPEEPVVGPRSVGYRVSTEALAFGGSTPTLTDAGVLAGLARIGTRPVDPSLDGLLTAAIDRVGDLFADAVDRVSLGRTTFPLVAVGGGAYLVPDSLPGVSAVLRPENGDVANAVGAAIAWVSGRSDGIHAQGSDFRESLQASYDEAIQRAVAAGADPDRVEIVEHVEIPLAYLTTPAVRVRVKAAGPLRRSTAERKEAVRSGA